MFVEDVLGQQMRAELREQGLAAHARYGTWLLIDEDGDEQPEAAAGEGQGEEGGASAGEGDSRGCRGGGVAGTRGAVRPHIVHMNGRSYLPPDVKAKVEARFRGMQQQQQEPTARRVGSAGAAAEAAGATSNTTAAQEQCESSGEQQGQQQGQGQGQRRPSERERLRATLRTELGLA
jgi:hypothetical protein